jgi:hypothetical protein
VSASHLFSLGYLEVLLSFAGVWAITSKKQWRAHWSLGCYLALHAVTSAAILLLYRWQRQHGSREALLAYKFYFYTYWVSFAIESILALIVIYCIFRLAMAPLRGLQSLGMLIFRWAAAISIAVALGSAFTPHQSGTYYLMAAISQLQRTQSILTLCLLLFVCFAIRPMGLSFRSRIFGVSLGLGIMATNNLVQAAWLANKPGISTIADMVNSLACCGALGLWTLYFTAPEPARRMIVLPTTSPLLRWNQISQVLGDDPGHVALTGLDSFAPSELEIMRRASLKGVTPFPKTVGA